MSTSPPTKVIAKPHDYPFWTGRLAVLLGLGVLGYYGYCFGLWGKNSLFLQFLFQCGCPHFTDELRYPREVDVVVPACRHRDVMLSPSGRLLYVQRNTSSFLGSAYVLNLETQEKIPSVSGKGSSFLLTDDLVFHSFHGLDQYVLDLTTGIKYPIPEAEQSQPSLFSTGDVNPSLFLKALSQMDQIFFIDDGFHPVVALSPDFRSHPENSFRLDALDFPSSDPDAIENFLKQNNIAYHYVPGIFSDALQSPDGRFIARNDGIYLSATNQLIVKAHDSRLKGWMYDGRGAIYTSYRCLFWLGLPGLDMTCGPHVPQPVILLKVPEKYLSSMPTP
jgi:hypothetical protein